MRNYVTPVHSYNEDGEDIRPLSDWGVGFGGQLVVGNGTSLFKDDSLVSCLGSWLGEVQFSEIANIRGEILEEIEAGLIAVLQTCLVCSRELRKEIWAGDVGIVDIIIDNMLDSIMVVESRGMDGITQEGCE